MQAPADPPRPVHPLALKEVSPPRTGALARRSIAAFRPIPREQVPVGSLLGQLLCGDTLSPVTRAVWARERGRCAAHSQQTK